MIFKLVLLSIVCLILLYGAFSYVDRIITDRHNEMMHACNCGMTDEEFEEVMKEDE